MGIQVPGSHARAARACRALRHGRGPLVSLGHWGQPGNGSEMKRSTARRPKNHGIRRTTRRRGWPTVRPINREIVPVGDFRHLLLGPHHEPLASSLPSRSPELNIEVRGGPDRDQSPHPRSLLCSQQGFPRCSTSFAITTVISHSDATAPIVNATILPKLFLSGIFIPVGDNAPAWISWVARTGRSSVRSR